MVTTFSPLTAGVNATFTIEARDPFSNVVLNSPDKIDFVVMSRARPTDPLVTASMEYRFQLHEATFSLREQGAYAGIITVTQRGGLLATYYTTVDFASPVLLASLHRHTAAVWPDPYAVSSSTSDATHYTRLDSQVDFEVERESLLADMPSPPEYPT